MVSTLIDRSIISVRLIMLVLSGKDTFYCAARQRWPAPIRLRQDPGSNAHVRAIGQEEERSREFAADADEFNGQVDGAREVAVWAGGVGRAHADTVPPLARRRVTLLNSATREACRETRSKIFEHQPELSANIRKQDDSKNRTTDQRINPLNLKCRNEQ